MRILFLTDNFPPEVNAPASRVYERAVYWAQWGHDVCILTSAPNFPEGKIYSGYQNKWYQTEVMNGIKVIRVKTFMAANRGFALRIVDFVSYMIMAVIVGSFLKKPDVIIATSPQFFTAVAGYSLSVIKRRPFIFELGDLWPASIKGVMKNTSGFLIKVVEKIELFLYRKSKAVIALTHAFKIDLVDRKIDPEKIFVVRNGVNVDYFQAQSKDKRLSTQFSLENHFVIGYIGTLGMAHGLENILLTAKLLENKSIKILFVGNGAEKEKLVKLMKDLNLNNVIFISEQPKSEIKKYWSLCDAAFVHLKNEFVFKTVIPSKIFEAMAMELPILFVGPSGEASEIIKRTGVGVCVDPDNPEALSHTLLKLSQDKTQLEKYKAACKKSVGQFTREDQAKAVLNVLAGVMKTTYDNPIV